MCTRSAQKKREKESYVLRKWAQKLKNIYT